MVTGVRGGQGIGPGCWEQVVRRRGMGRPKGDPRRITILLTIIDDIDLGPVPGYTYNS